MPRIKLADLLDSVVCVDRTKAVEMRRQRPIEALIARVHDLEARLGVAPEPSKQPRRSSGRLGPGGQWLAERLNNPRHPERLSRDEQDMLGNALAAYDRGSIEEAQEFLDMLWQHHQQRLSLQRSGFDAIMTLGTANVSDDDEPKA
jgi:hypothetical protein